MRCRSTWRRLGFRTGARGTLDRQPKLEPGSLAGNSLRLREAKEELQIPPRRDVRRFIKSFRSWRDQLIAEVLWVTGMRSAELCRRCLSMRFPRTRERLKRMPLPSRSRVRGRSREPSSFRSDYFARLRDIVIWNVRVAWAAMGRSRAVCLWGGREAAADIRDQSCVLDQLQTGRLAHLASSFEALLCRRTIGLPSGYWWPESAEGGANGTGTRAHGNNGKVSSSHRANAKRGA